MEKGRKGIIDDETLKEELDIPGMLAEAEQFIRTLENTWYDVLSEVKVRLQSFIFPSGVQMTKDGFRTVKLCGLFELINSSADLNSKMVTL